jgi:pyrroline-5-carboxylate reductase
MSSELQDARVGFIGCGAMAEALATGFLAAGVPAAQLHAADPAAAAREGVAERLGIQTGESNAAVVAASDVVILAVKPGLISTVLEGLGAEPKLGDRLWISIAAGVPLDQIEAALPKGARVVRVMPNTPALVGAGASVLCPNGATSEADRALSESLFDAVGTTWTAPNEGLIDAVTGLSGSGPAYVFLILEALGDAGVRVGLPRDVAYQLAFQTVYGATKLAIDSQVHPAILKDRVTSPGGTTIAGLQKLEDAGVRAALYAAVEAATQRSRELRGDS